MRYKVILKYPDGQSEQDDEVFATEAEANEYGLAQVGNYSTGGDVLNLSNPGDYPLQDDDLEYEVVEIDD